MGKHPYVAISPTRTPCKKCGGQIRPTLDDCKYACIQCGAPYNYVKA